jgi:hypothetical protein
LGTVAVAAEAALSATSRKINVTRARTGIPLEVCTPARVTETTENSLDSAGIGNAGSNVICLVDIEAVQSRWQNAEFRRE